VFIRIIISLWDRLRKPAAASLNSQHNSRVVPIIVIMNIRWLIIVLQNNSAQNSDFNRVCIGQLT